MVSKLEAAGKFLDFIKKAGEVFATKSESHIKEIIPQEGFKEIDMSFEKLVLQGCKRETFIEKAAQLPAKLNLPDQVREKILSIIDFVCDTDATGYQGFALNFKSKTGGQGQMIICFGGQTEKGDKVNFALLSMRASFMLAPTWVIMTHYKSGLFHSESKHEIIEKETPITEGQIESLFGFMAQKLLKICNDCLALTF